MVKIKHQKHCKFVSYWHSPLLGPSSASNVLYEHFAIYDKNLIEPARDSNPVGHKNSYFKASKKMSIRVANIAPVQERRQ